MRFTIKLNLNILVSATFTDNFYLEFNNIENIENWHDVEENVTKLEFEQSTTQKRMYVFLDGSTNPNYDKVDGDIETLVEDTDNPYLIFTCDIPNSSYTRLTQFIKMGIIELNQKGKTSLFVYTQNSENDELDKSLTLVDGFDGKFNHAINLKNVNVDIKGYARNYNYVYITILNRYYYVDSVELISSDITRLHLREDVLMSWKDLIKDQSAFVVRSQSNFNTKIVDDRFPLQNVKQVEYITPTPTGTGSLVNTTLTTDFHITNDYQIAVLSISTKYFHAPAYFDDIPSPTGTNLPTISPLLTCSEYLYFMHPYSLQFLNGALINQSDIMTYIVSAIALPFKPNVPYGAVGLHGFDENQLFYAKDDALCDDYRFHDVGSYPSGVSPVHVASTSAGASPYFIVADFTISATNSNYLDYEPYSNYEIFVPFVGWVTLNAIQIIDKRLIIYYTLDYHSGMGTAYIYSVTDKKLLWSSNCQFGIKLDLTATNQAENNRQKQSNTLNMIMGMIASGISVGVGIATENPVAIAGGVLSAGKTIASNVNSNMTMFERAQTSFGSGDATFHADIDIKIRRTYNPAFLTNDEIAVYENIQGKPANLYTSLTNLTGYVEVGEIHFNPMNELIYQDEITEIVTLLKSGVIF